MRDVSTEPVLSEVERLEMTKRGTAFHKTGSANLANRDCVLSAMCLNLGSTVAGT